MLKRFKLTFSFKISEHTSKIEKAQQALEAAIEAAKEATKAGLDEKMSKNEENKNEQLKEMMSALTEHSDRIKNVRSNLDEKMKPKAQQILENMTKKEEAARYSFVQKGLLCIFCTKLVLRRY